MGGIGASCPALTSENEFVFLVMVQVQTIRMCHYPQVFPRAVWDQEQRTLHFSETSQTQPRMNHSDRKTTATDDYCITKPHIFVNLISNRFLNLSNVSFPSVIRGMEHRVKESKSTLDPNPHRISKNSDS